MQWASRAVHLFRRLQHSQRVEEELNDDVQAYFEILIERGVSRGLSREQAERAARVRYEGPEQVKQRVREVRVGALIETALKDLRYSARVLRRSPGFTVFAVLTIALALGANAAIFSLVDGGLLKPAGYPEPERIVQLWEKPPGGARNGISAANYIDWARQSRSFEAIAAQTGGSLVHNATKRRFRFSVASARSVTCSSVGSRRSANAMNPRRRFSNSPL